MRCATAVRSAARIGTSWAAAAICRGPRPVLFFAPAQIAKRSAAPPAGWGAAELQARIAAAWAAFMRPVNDAAQPWLRVRTAAGAQAVQQACLALLDGQVDARDGWMLSL